MKSATGVELKRDYRMGARAESTAATRRSIADAWLALFSRLHYAEITLDLVAAEAGVAVQTVIRHFGSNNELVVAVAHEVAADEANRRAQELTGDVASAIRGLVGHYERIGDVVLRLLAQEGGIPALREAADAGRRVHYEWVDRAFEAHLAELGRGERPRRHGQLVAVTDVFVWKVLRRDLRFGRRQTEVAMTEIVTALLNGET